MGVGTTDQTLGLATNFSACHTITGSHCNSLNATRAGIANRHDFKLSFLRLVEVFHAFDGPSNHGTHLPELELSIGRECKIDDRACLITKSILVLFNVGQGCDFLQMLVVDEVRCPVASTENEGLASGIDNVRVSFRHHEGASVATFGLWTTQMRPNRSFRYRVSLNHILINNIY